MTLLDPVYISFWLKIAGLTALFAIIAVTIIALPLYGLWYEAHRDNNPYYGQEWEVDSARELDKYLSEMDSGSGGIDNEPVDIMENGNVVRGRPFIYIDPDDIDNEPEDEIARIADEF